MTLILSVIFKKSIEDNKRWEDFSKSIKTESHFFPKGKLLERIEEIATYATSTIKKERYYIEPENMGKTIFLRTKKLQSYQIWYEKDILILIQ